MYEIRSIRIKNSKYPELIRALDIAEINVKKISQDWECTIATVTKVIKGSTRMSEERIAYFCKITGCTQKEIFPVKGKKI